MDLQNYSLASREFNDEANHILWRVFKMSFDLSADQFEEICSAIITNPRRARYINTLVFAPRHSIGMRLTVPQNSALHIWDPKWTSALPSTFVPSHVLGEALRLLTGIKHLLYLEVHSPFWSIPHHWTGVIDELAFEMANWLSEAHVETISVVARPSRLFQIAFACPEVVRLNLSCMHANCVQHGFEKVASTDLKHFTHLTHLHGDIHVTQALLIRPVTYLAENWGAIHIFPDDVAPLPMDLALRARRSMNLNKEFPPFRTIMPKYKEYERHLSDYRLELHTAGGWQRLRLQCNENCEKVVIFEVQELTTVSNATHVETVSRQTQRKLSLLVAAPAMECISEARVYLHLRDIRDYTLPGLVVSIVMKPNGDGGTWELVEMSSREAGWRCGLSEFDYGQVCIY